MSLHEKIETWMATWSLTPTCRNELRALLAEPDAPSALSEQIAILAATAEGAPAALLDAAALTERNRELETWRSAMIDALMVSEIYSTKHETDPVAALNELLAWHQAVALDPQVSADAAKFVADRDAAIARAERAEAELARYANIELSDELPTDVPTLQARLRCAKRYFALREEEIRRLTARAEAVEAVCKGLLALTEWRPIADAPMDGAEYLAVSADLRRKIENCPPNCAPGTWERSACSPNGWAGGAHSDGFVAVMFAPLPELPAV